MEGAPTSALAQQANDCPLILLLGLLDDPAHDQLIEDLVRLEALARRFSAAAVAVLRHCPTM